MTGKPKNPLGMIRDPYAGDSFILPDTPCTDQRRAFLRRAKDIFKFLTISELSLKECKTKYEQLLLKKQLRPDTPLRLGFSDGRSTIMPVSSFLNGCNEGVEFLFRQVFVMIYGIWETFLFEILEKSFPQIGISENIVEQSLKILMKGNWDGKFCKMQSTLGIEYKATDLVNHFKDFEMIFGGTIFNNPFNFLDELAQFRHRIVHASSMLDNGKPIFINAQVLPGFLSFFALLTEYVDRLFSERFGYTQTRINPAEA
ncbi:MAG: hypothetical protein AB1641_13640 [Thermodesulfobacteriota bacterium]